MNKPANAMQLLEKHFDTAFAAPDGVKKLRELILTLAMQGKLVPQDPNDQPASELLKEIEAEKKRLVKEGKIKEPKLLPEIKPEEVPYELPIGWEWVRLGSVGEINPRNIVADDKETGFVPMPLIFSEYRAIHKFEIRKWAEIKKGYTHFADNDVALAKITPCFENGKSCVFRGLPNGIGAGTTELHIFRDTFNVICAEYLLAYLKNPQYIATGIPQMTGSAGQKRVPTDFFAQNPFPLPPFAEQRRIVAKIDKLMTRCDELERLRAERGQKRIAAHTAAINRLIGSTPSAKITPSPSPSFPRRRESSDRAVLAPRLRGGEPGTENTFTDAWQFISENFDELYSVKENVAELRKAILQLAVMGKLVPQYQNDQPASELLREIEIEKRRLVKEGKIKASAPQPEIKPEEIPYELPKAWQWVRLGELGETQTGTTPPKKDSENFGNHIPFIGPGDIKNYVIDYSGEGLSKIGLPKGRLIEKESVLMVCIGGSIGKHAINDRDITCNQQINSITPYKRDSVKYLFYAMRTSFFQEMVLRQAGGSATPIINKQKWSSIPVPLPPATEQHRIVAKIDQLMALCDELEKQIDATDGKQTALLDTVMAQV